MKVPDMELPSGYAVVAEAVELNYGNYPEALGRPPPAVESKP